MEYCFPAQCSFEHPGLLSIRSQFLCSVSFPGRCRRFSREAVEIG